MVLAVGACAWLVACGGGGAPQGAPGAGGAPAMPVDVVTLASKPIDRIGEYVGTVRSRRSATIQPQVEGFLTQILVKSGDHVTPGAAMFAIDATPQRAALASLEAVQAARAADAAFAKQQAERSKRLLDVGAASQQDYEQATTQQETAGAQLRAAEQQIQQQQAQLAYYRVLAPTAGDIGDVPVRVGDRVTPSTVLTTIDDNAGLEVYLSVPVQQAPRLHVGLPLRLVDDAGQTLASERVSFVSAAVDDSTQTVLVKAPVAARAGFRSNQFVRTQVVFDSTPGLTVPVVSVVRVNGQYFVFVAESGRGGTVAHQRAVSLGRVVGNDYVVDSGLEAGDRVIVSGIQKIGDGAPVAPTEARAGGGAPAGRGQPAGAAGGTGEGR